jgi:hypothetical protein
MTFEIRKVLVHSCFDKESDTPLMPKGCRCRTWKSTTEAAKLVESGIYRYVLAFEKTVQTEEICPNCSNDKNLKKTCIQCDKTGTVLVTSKYPVLGEDIILASEVSKENIKTVKVKRAPTLEKAHIQRAVISGNVHEQMRIEEYGETGFLLLGSLGAEVRNRKTGEIIVKGHPEPKDDIKTGTGRRFDYGRSL